MQIEIRFIRMRIPCGRRRFDSIRISAFVWIHLYTYQKLPDIDTLQLWQKHSTELPHRSAAVKDIVFIQPSSAAAEHVFSMLKASFDSQQDNALQDSLQSSLMLQFDKR